MVAGDLGEWPNCSGAGVVSRPLPQPATLG